MGIENINDIGEWVKTNRFDMFISYDEEGFELYLCRSQETILDTPPRKTLLAALQLAEVMLVAVMSQELPSGIKGLLPRKRGAKIVRIPQRKGDM